MSDTRGGFERKRKKFGSAYYRDFFNQVGSLKYEFEKYVDFYELNIDPCSQCIF